MGSKREAGGRFCWTFAWTARETLGSPVSSPGLVIRSRDNLR